jgi:hypothetical protein
MPEMMHWLGRFNLAQRTRLGGCCRTGSFTGCYEGLTKLEGNPAKRSVR